jgi:hypothetical protein
MKEPHKQWIDNASYESLLHRWRFAISGDPFFQGDTGEYYKKVMAEKKAALPPGEAANCSKRIGWER